MERSGLQKQLAIETHSIQADEFNDRYKSLGEDAYKNCFTYSRMRLNNWLDRFLPESGAGTRLLDVGCGTGYHLARYRERGFEVAGIDGSEGMLGHAREANPDIEFLQSDVDKIPYPDSSFDIVLSIEVLRYLPDISPCISEMARVLKPGGMCLVTAAPPLQANAYWPINRLSAAIKIGRLTQLKQFFHSSSRLKREFSNTGFDSVEVHGVYGGPMIWVEHLFPKLMPRLLKLWEPIDAKTVDAPLLRGFSNMYLVRAVRKG